VEIKLVLYPNKILNTPCQDVSLPVSDKIKKLAALMIVKMKEWNGVGLSGPQIGRSLNIIAINIKETKLVMLNPKILSWSKESYARIEGCLSFPGEFHYRNRPQNVTVNYYDLDGKEHTKEFSGVAAQVIMHEYDHLNGITFMDETINSFMNVSS
jgi:peptide deformylase